MPAVDLVALVEELDSWGPHEENTALLLEHQAFALGLKWSDRTVDPEDPDVVARREEAEAAGIEPPPFPPVVPIAHRPPKQALARIEQYTEQVAPYLLPQQEQDESDPEAVLDDWLLANGYV